MSFVDTFKLDWAQYSAKAVNAFDRGMDVPFLPEAVIAAVVILIVVIIFGRHE